MQNNISTNIHIPEEIWKAVKVKAAQEGRSMKDVILEGIALLLGEKPMTSKEPKKNSGRDLLLEFSGKVNVDLPQGSAEHDRLIYDK